MQRLFRLLLIFVLLPGALFAFDAKRAIRRISKGDPRVLAKISLADFYKLHNYQGQYYYIPRNIGQKAVRSLFGCFRNPDAAVKRLCADNLYQLKVTYVHKKLVRYYLKREKHLPTRLALQDLLVRINAERFAEARRLGDPVFLTKISFNEISELVEKGYPSGAAYTMRDFNFLKGGIENHETVMQIYVIKMMGRIPDQSGKVLSYLRRLRRRGMGPGIDGHIDVSIRCQVDPGHCPDLYRSDEEK